MHKPPGLIKCREEEENVDCVEGEKKAGKLLNENKKWNHDHEEKRSYDEDKG